MSERPRPAKKKKSAKDIVYHSEGSILDGLRTEWSMFWDTLFAEDEEQAPLEENSNLTSKDPFESGKIESLSLEKIKEITKALSKDRKTLNQKIEALNKQIEEKTAQLENLRLVGSGEEEAIQEIGTLSDQGASLIQKLDKINDRLKVARKREDQIKKSQAPAPDSSSEL